MVTKKSTKKKATKKTAAKAPSKAVENEKICAILQYFFPIGQIWYLVDDKMKKSKFAKFHLKQSLVLVVLSVAIKIILMIVPFLFVITWILDLGILVLWILGLINSIQGKEKEVPIVGKFASHFKF